MCRLSKSASGCCYDFTYLIRRILDTPTSVCSSRLVQRHFTIALFINMEPKPLSQYYHFKDPTKLYEVVGSAMHTETEEQMVVYRPLYENPAAPMFVRPLEMFMGEVDKPELGYKGPRFVQVESKS